MIRSLFRLLAAVSLALLLPAVPHAAAGPGLQYDEIVRMVVGGSTPPPPGNFQADLAALASPAAVAATPAPKKRRGFGNLGAFAGDLLTGNAGGALAGAATDAVVGDAMDAQMDRMLSSTMGAFAGAMRGLTQGRVERHSFYAGWERIDDVAAQTATIHKCDLHQVISLDLAKKTYSISDTNVRSSQPAAAPARPAREREATPAPQQPGTAVADFSNVVTPLGPRKLDGVDTTGYDDSSKFSISQATGSCRNGSFSFHSKTYYSGLATPRLVCPIGAPPPPQRYPQRPENFVASGGCRPTFSGHNAGPVPPAQNLSLYSTIAMSGSSGEATPAPAGSPPPGFVFLTERGNVRTLGGADAKLFEIPSDFTRVP